MLATLDQAKFHLSCQHSAAYTTAHIYSPLRTHTATLFWTRTPALAHPSTP